MTVPNTNTKVTWLGDGTNTSFPITFPYADTDFIRVVKVDAQGAESLLAQDYFIDSAAGAVLYPGYPPGEEPPLAERPPVLSDGEKLLIYRDTAATQEMSMPAGAITKTLERMIDKNTMLIQEIKDDVARALVLPVSSESALPLPSPIVPGASIAITEDGAGFRYGANPDGIEVALDDSAAALAVANEVKDKVVDILDQKTLFELTQSNEITTIERGAFTPAPPDGEEPAVLALGYLNVGEVRIANTAPDNAAAQTYLYGAGDNKLRRKAINSVRAELIETGPIREFVKNSVNQAVNTGRILGGWWYGKTKAATVVPAPNDIDLSLAPVLNYFDFTDNIPYAALADGTGWVAGSPLNLLDDDIVLVTKYFLDIAEGQIAGRAIYSTEEADWTYYPNLMVEQDPLYLADKPAIVTTNTPQTITADKTFTGNVTFASDVGTVFWFAGAAAPAGSLACNGAAISRTDYARLFAVIGTTYGAGDGSTTFNLPDLRGQFIRGLGGNSAAPGVRQGDAIREIYGTFACHVWTDGRSGAFFYVPGEGGLGRRGVDLDGSAQTSFTRFSSAQIVPAANENRPVNMAMLACIKY